MSNFFDARLSELTTTLWRSKVWSSTVSSMSYQRGMLPLGEADAALNPKLDKHFSTMSELLQSRETYAGEARSDEWTRACLLVLYWWLCL